MSKFLINNRLRYLKYIVLFMLLYPISVLAAQGQISVKGQSITMKHP